MLQLLPCKSTHARALDAHMLDVRRAVLLSYLELTIPAPRRPRPTPRRPRRARASPSSITCASSSCVAISLAADRLHDRLQLRKAAHELEHRSHARDGHLPRRALAQLFARALERCEAQLQALHRCAARRDRHTPLSSFAASTRKTNCTSTSACARCSTCSATTSRPEASSSLALRSFSKCKFCNRLNPTPSSSLQRASLARRA